MGETTKKRGISQGLDLFHRFLYILEYLELWNARAGNSSNAPFDREEILSLPREEAMNMHESMDRLEAF